MLPPFECQFWVCGDDPADRRLVLLNMFLSEFDRKEVDTSRSVSQRSSSLPRQGHLEEVDGECVWLLAGEAFDIQTGFAFSFLTICSWEPKLHH